MKNINLAGPYFFNSVYENLGNNKTRVILSNDQILYSSSDSDEYNFFDFYDQHYAGYYFDNLKNPYMILSGAFTMPYLEKIKYDPETVDFLNENGLHIYLLEILHFDFDKKKKCLIDLFDKKISDIQYEDLPLQIVLNENNYENLYSFELESISIFVEKNNLKKVTVCTNENATEKILGPKYPTIKIRPLDIFLKGYRGVLTRDIEIDSSSIKKRFWSGNWRYDVHRHMTAAFLIDKDVNLSFIHKKPIDHLRKKLWFDFQSWKKSYPKYYKKITEGADKLYKEPPMSFDKLPMCPSRKNVLACPSGFEIPIESYIESFCCILTETKFAHPFPCFSEKVINAIMCKRPFILVAPALTLQYLKSAGFKTFDKWWDESYDQEADHEKRLIKIFDLIEKLSKLTIDDCRKIYDEMYPILNHNIENLELVKN